MSELKQTPLYSVYKEYGGKTIDFGGWALPVQFAGIKEEHHTTREKAGLFDVSHMGEIAVKGENSESFLQKMVTNNVSKIKIGQAQYTFMCNEHGGVIDDFLIYKLDENDYLLVVNAANTEKDFNWLKRHQTNGVDVEDVSPQYAQLALQGPKAEQILQKLTDSNLKEIKFFRFDASVEFHGIEGKAIVSRTGYTGEDGFEIYLQSSSVAALWKAILEAGEEEGIQPVGLGARDTLRFEAGLALYGQDLSEEITPIEAGLGFAVKIDKEADFIGKEALTEQKTNGSSRKLVGFEMLDKGIPRHGYEVLKNENVIGHVTSGTQSPTLGKNLGTALIPSDLANEGEEIDIQVRKKTLKAKIIPTPFYKRK
ncbi:glycine cleavage system aminomethyltransferase GcvT [Allobacillus sp. GCM10007491]|uniref:Aminomethyltransferase n=1 Tax=Allobacillus saliphilus TaxID=2912308 RepID=A0A941HTR2_9BACI|nr:glycine cleavage system aminomethyltransferase GcvT [Allobacillus saliphilus]MBR7554197.1 glycine cleavage system aminomethyltransferase GcvT [Allobacillus saliphilus]